MTKTNEILQDMWLKAKVIILKIIVLSTKTAFYLSGTLIMKVKVAQQCPTLCNPMDTVHGILQARILEWVAFPFSRGSSQPRDWTQVSCIAGRFFTSRATKEAQEYWSGQPIPSPADLPTQKSNWGLLHCRRILYQLSYKGSINYSI